MRTDQPLVAIATPVYNGAKFLEETLEAVQALDYPNLVHVVQDNASTDGTAAILDRFANRRVRVITRRSAETVPMAQNWNAACGLVPASAKYFWLLCGDDLLTKQSISKLVDVAEREPDVNIVGCLWRAEGLCGEELNKAQSIFDGSEVMRKYFRRETMALSGMNALFSTRLLAAKTPFYDCSISSFDADANLRAALRGKYGFVHEELLLWRQHADSTSSSVSSKQLEYHTDWLLLLDRYGPYVLGHREYLECRRAYRNYLLRRLMILRWRQGERALFDRYVCELRQHDDGPGVGDFGRAIVDWIGYRLRGRSGEIGRPLTPARPIVGGGIAVRTPPI